MIILPFFVIACLIISLALSSKLWFRRVPIIKALLRDAERLDKITVAGCEPPVTIYKLRYHDYCGDKIVVSHFLVRLIPEFEGRMRNGVWRSAIVPLLFVVFIVGVPLADQASNLKSTAATQAGANDKTGQSLKKDDFNFQLDTHSSSIKIVAFITTSIGLLLFSAESIFYYLWFRDQIGKFTHVFELPPSPPSKDVRSH